MNNWLMMDNWLVVYWLMMDNWLMIHWLMHAHWLVVDWFMVFNWVLNNLVLVLEDWGVVSLVVSIAVSVESLHESLGFVMLGLEEGVTELSESGTEAVQLVSQGVSKGAADCILGGGEGISLSVKE